jgi:hypothetical protein
MTTKDTKVTTKKAKGMKFTKGFWVGLALGVVLVVALAFAAAAFAGGDGPAIDWWIIGGGGGGASGGNVTLDSTLGQPIVGPSRAGNAWLGAGYWYAEQPVQVFLPMVAR